MKNKSIEKLLLLLREKFDTIETRYSEAHMNRHWQTCDILADEKLELQELYAELEKELKGHTKIRTHFGTISLV